MCNYDDIIHSFQEYNDTLLMTYLAMFTNCSRYAVTSWPDFFLLIHKFFDSLDHSSLEISLMLSSFLNLQHNERVS